MAEGRQERQERLARRVKKMAAKELPNQLDATQLEAALRDLPRSAREALVAMARGSQANFDHLNSEQKRTTQYHNEHADETNFIKDEVIPHEHPSFGTKNTVGYDVRNASGDGMFIAPTNFGGGATRTVDAYSVPTMVPAYIDKPCTILQLKFEVTALPSGAQQDVKMFVYAGDYDGNWPDTLLWDGTGSPVLCSTTGFKYTSAFELEVGPGWIWLGLSITRSDSAPDLGIWSYDNGWNTVAHSEIRQQGFMPFPFEKWALDTGFVGLYSAISMFQDLRDVPGPPDALPASYMDDLNNVQNLSTPFYNSYAPIIEYRVR